MKVALIKESPNIFYVTEGGIFVGFIRGFLSVPGHMIFSGIWGFALGHAKFRPDSEQPRIIIIGLAGAMVMHGLFNLSLEVFDLLGLAMIALVLIPLGWWILHRNIEKANHEPYAAHILAEQSLSFNTGDEKVIPPEISTETTIKNIFEIKPGLSREDTIERVPNEITQAMGYCTACGVPHSWGARYCRACGKPLDEQ